MRHQQVSCDDLPHEVLSQIMRLCRDVATPPLVSTTVLHLSSVSTNWRQCARGDRWLWTTIDLLNPECLDHFSRLSGGFPLYIILSSVAIDMDGIIGTLANFGSRIGAIALKPNDSGLGNRVVAVESLFMPEPKSSITRFPNIKTLVLDQCLFSWSTPVNIPTIASSLSKLCIRDLQRNYYIDSQSLLRLLQHAPCLSQLTLDYAMEGFVMTPEDNRIRLENLKQLYITEDDKGIQLATSLISDLDLPSVESVIVHADTRLSETVREWLGEAHESCGNFSIAYIHVAAVANVYVDITVADRPRGGRHLCVRVGSEGLFCTLEALEDSLPFADLKFFSVSLSDDFYSYVDDHWTTYIDSTPLETLILHDRVVEQFCLDLQSTDVDLPSLVEIQIRRQKGTPDLLRLADDIVDECAGFKSLETLKFCVQSWCGAPVEQKGSHRGVKYVYDGEYTFSDYFDRYDYEDMFTDVFTVG